MLAQEALVAAAAYRHSLYDMMYAVLARRQGATVITLDSRFAVTLREMRISVFCPAIEGPSSGGAGPTAR
jgi:predicted nucleic acid-binding protein